jgi:hypothetical protein
MDERIWFYIIAAVIWYFVKRKKKAPDQEEQDTSATNRPQQQRKQVTFEELLREITEQREQETRPEPRPAPAYVAEAEEDLPVRKMREEQERIAKEGSYRHFSDDETRRVYEESVRQAEGFDIAFSPDEKFAKKSLLKAAVDNQEPTFGDEIRGDLQDIDSARKAVIYAEILNRKY